MTNKRQQWTPAAIQNAERPSTWYAVEEWSRVDGVARWRILHENDAEYTFNNAESAEEWFYDAVRAEPQRALRLVRLQSTTLRHSGQQWTGGAK